MRAQLHIWAALSPYSVFLAIIAEPHVLIPLYEYTTFNNIKTIFAI